MAAASMALEKFQASGSVRCRGSVVETAESSLGKMQSGISCKLASTRSNCARISRQDAPHLGSSLSCRESSHCNPVVAESYEEKETGRGHSWSRVAKSSLVCTSLAISLLLQPQFDTSRDSLSNHAHPNVAVESLTVGLGMYPTTLPGVDEVMLQDGARQVNWLDWEPQTEHQQKAPLWLGGSLGWEWQEADGQSQAPVGSQKILKTQTAFYTLPVDAEDDEDDDELFLDSFPEGLGFCPMWHNSRLETTVPLGPVMKALPPGFIWPAATSEAQLDSPVGEEAFPASPQEVPELKSGYVKRLGALRVGINEVTPVWEVLVGGCFSL